MDLQLDEQQKLLQQSLDKYLATQLAFAKRRELRTASQFIAFWKNLDRELGIGGAGLPESAGGFGGGTEAEMIVASSLGRALAVTPYVWCNVLSASLLADLGQFSTAQAIIADGVLAITCVDEPQTRGDIALLESWADPVDGGWKLTGTKIAVDFAEEADFLLVPARISDGDFALFVLGREQFSPGLKRYRLIDDTPSADLLLDGLLAPHDALLAQGGNVLTCLQSAVNRATAALCAEAHGVADTMLWDTIAYTKEREQFGSALASFQALQHRMVDMWLKVQEMEAAALLAALKADDPAAVSAAKATMAEHIRIIGQEAVQLHGAMGLTDELRVGHYFKRATVLEQRLGSADFHVERYRQMRSA